MAFLYQHRRNSKFVTSLPEGLQELMADISREVLEKQPNEARICTFIADYLEVLREIRHRVLALDDIFKSSIQFDNLLIKNGIDCQRASQANQVIRNVFSRYVNDLETLSNANEWPQFDEFELFKELVKSCDFRSDELFLIKTILRNVFRDFFEKYSQYRKTYFPPENCNEENFKCFTNKAKALEILNKAATKIQAYFRSYSVRNAMKSSGILPIAIQCDPDLHEADTTEATKMIEEPFLYYTEKTGNINCGVSRKMISASEATWQIQKSWRKHQESDITRLNDLKDIVSAFSTKVVKSSEQGNSRSSKHISFPEILYDQTHVSGVPNSKTNTDIGKSNTLTDDDELILTQDSRSKPHLVFGLPKSNSLQGDNFNGKRTDEKIEKCGGLMSRSQEELISKDSSIVDITPEASMVDLTINKTEKVVDHSSQTDNKNENLNNEIKAEAVDSPHP